LKNVLGRGTLENYKWHHWGAIVKAYISGSNRGRTPVGTTDKSYKLHVNHNSSTDELFLC